MNGTGIGRLDGRDEVVQRGKTLEYADKHPNRGTHTLDRATCAGSGGKGCGLLINERRQHPGRFSKRGF